jgi:Na+/melibiose symporter-like transporter
LSRRPGSGGEIVSATLVVLSILAVPFLVWVAVTTSRRDATTARHAEESRAQATAEHALRVRKLRLEIRLLKLELEKQSRPFD